jgi:hypothetical protein
VKGNEEINLAFAALRPAGWRAFSESPANSAELHTSLVWILATHPWLWMSFEEKYF